MNEDSGLYGFDGNGLKVATTNQIYEFFKTKLEEIIVENVNLEQNTPDGQILNIFTQATKEMSDVLQYTYNAINVNQAEGVNLDNLVALNGIKRNGGSFTSLPITLKINQNVSLKGLDDDINNEDGTGFSISDDNNNKYILEKSIDLEYTQEHDTFILDFRAQYKGVNEPILNSIKNIDTPILGVISVNNESAPTYKGSEEESDYDLRNRFFNTYSNSGYGSFEQIKSSIYDVLNVYSVDGENNRQDYTSIHGTPRHTIWIIVEGGADKEIAEAMYKRLGTGTGLRGEVEVDVVDRYGTTETMRFDRPTYEMLYVKFNVKKKVDSYIIDIERIKNDLINNYFLEINKLVDISAIDKVLTEADSNLVYVNIEVSKDNITWSNIVKNTDINYKFILQADNITITEINNGL